MFLIFYTRQKCLKLYIYQLVDLVIFDDVMCGNLDFEKAFCPVKLAIINISSDRRNKKGANKHRGANKTN